MTAEDSYRELVDALTRGKWPFGLEEIHRILAAVGRTPDDLMEDAIARAPTVNPGDACQCAGCDGRLVIRSSLRCADSQVQRMQCPRCGWLVKRAVPADTIRRRRRADRLA